MKRGTLALALIFALGLSILYGAPSGASTTWNEGDVFAGAGSGDYFVYDNAGVFKEQISGGGGGSETTGCAFDANEDFWGTWFSESTVRKFDGDSPHTELQSFTVTPQGAADAESITFAANGDFYVGSADGDGDVHRYDSAGVFQQEYDVATEARGSDWIDLAADQRTLFYTSEGDRILRYDLMTSMQLADFGSTTGPNYALRILPPGDGSGGVLVASSDVIARLDGSGSVVQTYDATGENLWFGLNLDPNGTSFWSGGFNNLSLYRFNIATGAIEVGPIPTNQALAGICVKGEITAGVPPEDEGPSPVGPTDFNWLLRNSNSAGLANFNFPYGNGTHDNPNPGNWDGTNSPHGDTAGVTRGHSSGHLLWLNRNANSAGGPDAGHFFYGNAAAGDMPVVGYWDNPAFADSLVDPPDGIGVARMRSTGRLRWLLRVTPTPGAAQVQFEYGNWMLGDVPVVGDFDGDGLDDIGIARPIANGHWLWKLRNSATPGAAEHNFEYGSWMLGDQPVAGNWDGSGAFGPGVARPISNERWRWYLKNTLTTGDVAITPFEYGNWGAGDVPRVGDWDGDDDDTVGVIRP